MREEAAAENPDEMPMEPAPDPCQPSEVVTKVGRKDDSHWKLGYLLLSKVALRIKIELSWNFLIGWDNNLSKTVSRLFFGFWSIRPHDKVWIPQDQHPEINFVGLLIGPRGNTLKSLEMETGGKIIIRSASSQSCPHSSPTYITGVLKKNTTPLQAKDSLEDGEQAVSSNP